MTTEQKTAHCPHCNSEEFIVTQSEIKCVRFLATDKYPYRKEEEISSEGKGYESMVCGGCGVDLNASEIIESLLEGE
ncbi:MAG: hypothetical protein ACR2P5_03475 [Gammaproteobacteria bacterium]